MKLFLKFLFSLLLLPFLIPWFIADKLFEYLVQPFILKQYNLEIAREKRLTLRWIKLLALVALLLYLAKSIIDFVRWLRLKGSDFSWMIQFKTLFRFFYNNAVKTLNWLLRPLNQLLYYGQGGLVVDWWDFLLFLYLWVAVGIIVITLLYRLFVIRNSLKKAVGLRNRAIRDVDIVHFTETGKPDEIFLGLDLHRSERPLFVKRGWLKGHLQVVGGPGSGKTESIIQPIWFQEVRRNVATFVLDGKASHRNVDKFFTIASSLAQGHEIRYFNPADPSRSDSYNPLLKGAVGDVKQKIMTSINWAEYSAESREQLDAALNAFLNAIEENDEDFSLGELQKYFQSREHIIRKMQGVRNSYVKNSLQEILNDFSVFQKQVSFFIEILRDLLETDYAALLNTSTPRIDIVDIYLGRKDCYFTLPIQTNETTSRFLGKLILQDIYYSFQQIATKDNLDADEGLLIIDEMGKFVNPYFIRLLEASRNAGVSVCYTNQSLAELDDPALNLSKMFVEQLADHTNMVCCFQLGSTESIQAMIKRFGKLEARQSSSQIQNISDPDFLKHLEIGRCILFIRQPRFLTVLKTGYFKFEKLLRFAGGKEGRNSGR